jgi:hypothetical protein
MSPGWSNQSTMSDSYVSSPEPIKSTKTVQEKLLDVAKEQLDVSKRQCAAIETIANYLSQTSQVPFGGFKGESALTGQQEADVGFADMLTYKHL